MSDTRFLLEEIISELNNIKNKFTSENYFHAGLYLGSLMENLKNKKNELEKSENEDDEVEEGEKVLTLKSDLIKELEIKQNCFSLLADIYESEKHPDHYKKQILSLLICKSDYFLGDDGKLKLGN